MAGTEVVGKAEVTVGGMGDENADLQYFERIAGSNPRSVIENIAEVAIDRCRVKDCELRVVCEDKERRGETWGDEGPNPSSEYAYRDVTATVTCARSGGRTACRGAIGRTTDRIQEFLDGVKRFDGRVHSALESHMSPAEAKAEKIRKQADKEAERVLAEARAGLDNVETGELVDFRKEFDLQSPAENQLALPQTD